MGRRSEQAVQSLLFLLVIKALPAGQTLPSINGFPGLPEPPKERVPIGTVAPSTKNGAELVSLTQVWSQASSNGFTDVARFRDRWYCTLREGSARLSHDGTLRILSSSDAQSWSSAAVISYPGFDLRDPKFSLTPDRRLMLSAAMRFGPEQGSLQSLAWYSLNGRDWGDPFKIGDPGFWLWRVSWHLGNAFSMAYSTGPERFLRLYSGPEGLRFQTLADKVYAENAPTEATLVFSSSDIALCLLRRDGGTGTASLGTSRPPYRAWQWRDLGVRLASPNLLRLPDDRLVAAGLLDDGKPRVSLCWLDASTGTLSEFLTLPSAGESGYPGMVWQANRLWISYHSSHEGKTAVYLATVRVPEPE
jgi:hypothetical protein